MVPYTVDVAKEKTRSIGVFVVSIGLSIAFWCVSASLEHLSAQDQKASDTMYLQADGRRQTVDNKLHVSTVPSNCYEDAELNCRQYGPFVHVVVGTASMSIIRKWMAIADGRRMAADGLKWRTRRFSPIALPTAATVVAAGLAASCFCVGVVSNLWTTT